jgi:hypothetical protein
MNKLFTRISIVILTFVIGIFSVAGWFYYQESQKPQIILPNHRWEQIFFKSINNATNLAGLEELREIPLNREDIEIRVWRGFGLSPLEGIILKQTDGIWTAFHITTNDYVEADKAKIKRLSRPKSGWESLWKQINDKGILMLRDPSEIECEDSGFDGMSYVVEINQNKIYRTYQMRSGGKCEGVQQMEQIGEIIGLEFDSGHEECKTTEWFACMTFNKTRHQTNQ